MNRLGRWFKIGPCEIAFVLNKPIHSILVDATITSGWHPATNEALDQHEIVEGAQALSEFHQRFIGRLLLIETFESCLE